MTFTPPRGMPVNPSVIVPLTLVCAQVMAGIKKRETILVLELFSYEIVSFLN